MKKKLFLILLIIGVMTGCSANANLTINDDYSTKEEINIIFNKDLAKNYNNVDDYVSIYTNYYKSALDFKNYSYSIDDKYEDDLAKVSFKRNSDDLCKGIKESAFSQFLYENINCEIADDSYIIKSEGQNIFSQPSSKKKFDYDSLIVNMELPVAAEDSNCDDESDNVYTWRYDKDSTSSDKSLYIKINKKKLDDNYANYVKDKKSEENKSKLSLVIIGLIFISIILFAAFALYKKYQKNKFEY